MSCQLCLTAYVNDLKAARRYLFPSLKEAFVDGMFDAIFIRKREIAMKAYGHG